MKYILSVILVSLIGYGAYATYNYQVEQNTVTVQNGTTTAPVIQKRVFIKDPVSEAEKEIQKQLDILQEETDKLNKEMEEENIRHENKVNELQAELDRITTVKMGFSAASTVEQN